MFTMLQRCLYRIFRIWEGFQDKLKEWVLCSMARLALIGVRYPKRVVVAGTVISLTLPVVGLLTNFNMTMDLKKMLVPENHFVVQQGMWIESMGEGGFPDNYNKVQAVVYADGDDMLGVDGIRRVFDVVDAIRESKLYRKVCTNRLNPDMLCAWLSPTGFWPGHSKVAFEKSIETDSDVLEYLSRLRFADGMPVDRRFIFGRVEPEMSNELLLLLLGFKKERYELASTEAFIVTLLLPPGDMDDTSHISTRFMVDANKALRKLQKQWENDGSRFRMEYLTDASYNQEVMRGFIDDAPLVSLAYAVMAAFCALTLRKWDPIKSRCFLGVGAVYVISLAILTGYGLLFICGVPMTGVTQIFPFVMVGIGLDATYIIINAFDRLNPEVPLEDRIVKVVYEVGISIFIANLTTIVAFYLGSFASLPSVKWFVYYAGPTVIIYLFYKMTIFIALLTLDEERQTASRRDCCPCFIHRPNDADKNSADTSQDDDDGENDEEDETDLDDVPESNDDTRRGNDGNHETKVVSTAHGTEIAHFTNTPSESEVLIDRLYNKYVDFVVHPIGKTMIILGFCVLFAFGVLGALRQSQRFDFRLVLPRDSYVRDFYDVLDEHVTGGESNQFYQTACYFRYMDFSERSNQLAALKYVDDILGMPYITSRPATFWLRDFLNFQSSQKSIDNNITAVDLLGEKDLFYAQLDEFLSTPPYNELYRFDVVRNEAKNDIIASRVPITYDNLNVYDSALQINALMDLIRITSSQPVNVGKEPKDWPVFSYGDLYILWVIYEVIIREILTMVVLGLSGVFLISLVFLPHPIGCIIITPVVAMIYVELLAVLYLGGVTINSVSSVGLTVSIGLVVDYNMHIVLTYFEIGDNLDDYPGVVTRDDRIRMVLHTMGRSVMQGGFSTFLGAIPLVLSQSEGYHIFFVTLMGIVCLGVGHGLLLTPVMLSLLAPHKAPMPPMHLDEDLQKSKTPPGLPVETTLESTEQPATSTPSSQEPDSPVSTTPTTTGSGSTFD